MSRLRMNEHLFLFDATWPQPGIHPDPRWDMRRRFDMAYVADQLDPTLSVRLPHDSVWQNRAAAGMEPQRQLPETAHDAALTASFIDYGLHDRRLEVLDGLALLAEESPEQSYKRWVFIDAAYPEAQRLLDEIPSFIRDAYNGPVSHIAKRFTCYHSLNDVVRMLADPWTSATQPPDQAGTMPRSLPSTRVLDE